MGPSSLCLAQKIMKNDVSYMGEKKLLVLGGWWVGWRWGGGSQLQDHHHYDGLKKLLKMMYHTGGKKIFSIRWLAGGVLVGWGWVAEASCRTITIATGSKNREK